MIQTVEKNEIWYTLRQIEHANRATSRKLNHAIGSPSIGAFKAILIGNLIKNCPVTIAGVDIAEGIHGPCISTFKGNQNNKHPNQLWQIRRKFHQNSV